MVPPPPVHRLSPITFLYTTRLRIKSEALASRVPAAPEALNFSVVTDEADPAKIGKRRLRPVTLIDIIKLKRVEQWFGEESQEPASQFVA